jgi:ABC-type glycerol-3-phosphate transport system substrate-binding protein
MKRIIQTACIILLAAANVFAGGGKQAAQPSGGGKVKIEFWSWIATMDQVIADFNSSQNEVEVVPTIIGHPDLSQKMTIALTAGVGAPDVFQMTQRHFPNYSSTGRLYDITSGTSDKINEFSKGLQGIVTYNGKVYGLPTDMSPGVFYYRSDLYQENQFQPIAKFSQISAFGKQLRSKGKYIIPITTPAGTWACNIIGLLVQSRGGLIYTADGKIVGNNKDLLVVLQWLNDMLRGDVAANLPHLTPEMWASLKDGSVISWLFNTPESANLKKNAPELSGKWNIAPLPQWDDLGTRYTGLWGGSVLAIPEQSQKKDAALKFIRWMTSTVEGQVSLSKHCGFVPAMNSAKSDPFYRQGDPYFGGTNLFDQILDTPAFYYFDWAVTETVVGEQMDLMFAGRITPQQAYDAIIKNLAEKTGRQIQN